MLVELYIYIYITGGFMMASVNGGTPSYPPFSWNHAINQPIGDLPLMDTTFFLCDPASAT